MYGWMNRYRVLWLALVYGALISLANYLAFWLRFDGAIPSPESQDGLRLLPLLVAIYGCTFIPFGLFRGLWRYTSIWDLRDLVGAVVIGSVIFYGGVHFWLDLTRYPRSVIILTGILSLSLIGGIRLARRAVDEFLLPKNGNRVLIIGAGNAGELIARDLKRKGHRPIGFIDDDTSKTGQAIHHIPVLGTREAIPRVLATAKPDQVLIAMPSAGAATIREFVNAFERFKIPITTLPSLREIVSGRVSVSQVRRVAVEDLLPRLPVHLNIEHARALVEGQRVLVTGAGGSIGSELCRQVATLDPDRLILYERYENNLYAAANTLPKNFRIQAALGDVTDRRRLHEVLRQYRPDVIFHAAAHKHVPLMELNPCEAVKNNVIGTRMVAEAAAHFGVARFILISTDKAVNPTSLMGATKRVAELVVQSIALRSGPRWGTVRFGNVLGSTGSVIPRWQEQIAAGGPVTVTDPNVQRYFMLIGEAVQLILQAAAVMRGGEIFALEMGEQINLLKMARDLIRLSGFIPDDEIPIEIVGLRAGEKLSEELVGPDEVMEPSLVDKVLQLRAMTPPDPDLVTLQVAELGKRAIHGDRMGVIRVLCTIVPTFHPGPVLTAFSEAGRSERERRQSAPRPSPVRARLSAKRFRVSASSSAAVAHVGASVGTK
jgi:FlaA1/EpsC-like NDP-sugar epimerase